MSTSIFLSFFLNIIFLFQTDRFVGQFCLTQVVLSEIVFAVYIYRIRKLMNQNCWLM